MNRTRISLTAALLSLCLLLSGCMMPPAEGTVTSFSLEDIPAWSGEPYVAVDGNQPDFPEEDMTSVSFETYSELDTLGRCGVAYANVGQDLMPTEDRESISSVTPSGWINREYDGEYLYNRCHLIGFQLTGENANEENLITGTRYMNVDGMLGLWRTRGKASASMSMCTTSSPASPSTTPPARAGRRERSRKAARPRTSSIPTATNFTTRTVPACPA